MQMLQLHFPNERDYSPRVLCLGAHCDDIEIGAGGTILKLALRYPSASFLWVVFSSDEQREKEALTSVDKFLSGAAKKQVTIKTFRNSFFPYIGKEIKEYFEEIKSSFEPDLIFTHYGEDLHQDRRLISDLTWNTFRDHFILEYEIPKYDGDLGRPNVYVPLSEEICRTKIKYIMESFRSQASNHWFTEDTFFSLLRLRGIESNSPDRYAEAFYCRKVVLAL